MKILIFFIEHSSVVYIYKMDNNTNFSIFQDIQKVYFPNEIIFNLILSFFLRSSD